MVKEINTIEELLSVCKNYIESNTDVEHTENEDVKYVLNQYQLGKSGYYYRVVGVGKIIFSI